MDDAETDAIEAGAEEVNVIDEENNTLEFITDEQDLFSAKNSLVAAGYQCHDATITYIPNVAATPNGIEKKTLEKMVDLLMDLEIVTNVHTNASWHCTKLQKNKYEAKWPLNTIEYNLIM